MKKIGQKVTFLGVNYLNFELVYICLLRCLDLCSASSPYVLKEDLIFYLFETLLNGKCPIRKRCWNEVCVFSDDPIFNLFMISED